MTKRGLFLQYSIKSLISIFTDFIEKLEIGEEYSKADLLSLYQEEKNYESSKTSSIFLNKILEVIFPEFRGSRNKLNHWGILARNNLSNLSLIKNIIFLNSFKNAYIFELECEIVYDFIDDFRYTSTNKNTLRNVVINELIKILKGTEFEGKDVNAKNKFTNVISNLIEVGVIIEENKTSIKLKYLEPDWRLFLLYLYEKSLPVRKISIPHLINEDVIKKHLFMENQSVMPKLIEIERKGFITIENLAGIQQIHLNYNSLGQVIEEIDK